MTRNLNFTRDYLEAVQKVSLDDIQRVARQYLTEENQTVVSLNPRGTFAAEKSESSVLNASPVVKFELSNGLRLLVREDARLPLVSMAAVFRGGLLAENAQSSGITRLMSKVLVKGTKTRTAEEIADTIEAVGGHLGSDAGNNSFSISLEVTQPDLRLGAELLCDVLLNATMPEKAIAREKEVQLAGIRDEEEQMTTVARNILRAALFGPHPYALRVKGTPESVTRLTQKRLACFSRSLCRGEEWRSVGFRKRSSRRGERDVRAIARRDDSRRTGLERGNTAANALRDEGDRRN